MSIKMGIIGLGGISHVHAGGIQRSGDLDLYAVCDIKPDVLEKRGDMLTIPKERRFLDYREMLKLPGLQAVSICTPNNVHYPMALDAIAAGIPYAVEKPVSNDGADVDDLAQKTRAAQLSHMVCFSYRFKAAARFARDIVKSGQLGTIFHMNGVYMQDWGIGNAVPLVWRFVKEITGSGALGDLGCHLIDLIRFISGDEFANVTAQTGTFTHERMLPDGSGVGKVDVDDYVNILGTMGGGAAVSLNVTRFGYSRGNFQRIEIYGEKGAIRYRLEEEDTLDICMGDIMRHGHVWTRVPVPARYRSDQMQSFADILNGRGDGLAATIEDGARNQHLVDAILLSAEQGRRIDMK